MDSQLKLESFSHEVLLNIFKNLNARDLVQLSKTCKRFNNLVKDSSLWHVIDARTGPRSRETIKFCLDRVNEKTDSILFSGNHRIDKILDTDMYFKTLSFKHLKCLALENLQINQNWFEVTDIPADLEELSLRYTFIQQTRAPIIYFHQCALHFKKLRVLLLDGCNWVYGSSFAVFSKIETLEILSLYLCRQFGGADLAYTNMGSFGYKNLKILDVRFTSFGNDICEVFNKKVNELYFTCYSTMFHGDDARRRYDILHGAPKNENSAMDAPLLVDDCDPTSFKRVFDEDIPLRKATCEVKNLTDDKILTYRYMQPISEYIPPKSVLYERPYAGPCKCGWEEKRKGKLFSNHTHDDVNDEEECTKLQQYINYTVKRNADVYQINPAGNVEYQDLLCGDTKCESETDHLILSLLLPREWQDTIYRVDLRNTTVIEVTMENSSLRHQIIPIERFAGEQTIQGIYNQLKKWRTQNKAGSSSGASPSSEPGPSTSKSECTKRKHGEDEDEAPEEKRHKFENPEHPRYLPSVVHPSQPNYMCVPDDIGQETITAPSTGRPIVSEGVVVKVVNPLRFEDIAMRFIDVSVIMPQNANEVTKLRCLSLRGYERVTDKSLEWLQNLRLQLLDVSYTKVTENGLKKFESVNPDCRLVHETRCTCLPKLHF